ncbi:MAG: hypothetical protein NC401_14440, partial [Ruminococcus sp.]|nr:hypothetical protein [Ruminococcus sp.]
YYFGDTEIFDYQYWGFLFMAHPYENLTLHCVVGCVISLAVTLLSGLIYVRRDAKTVGNPIASRVFFEVVLTLGCVTVLLAFTMWNSGLWGLLIAATAYIIINIIVSRAKINALSFVKWGAKYLATAAVFMTVMIAAIKTGGFGYITLRPDAEHLEGAEFEISYYDPEYDWTDEYHSHQRTLCTNALTAEQADKVMEICKKHILNGRADINVFSEMTGIYFDDDTTYLHVIANSERHYDERPFPKSQFGLDSSGFSDKYCLAYDQNVVIPLAEAKALADELLALDCVYDYVKEPVYTETGDYAEVYYN